MNNWGSSYGIALIQDIAVCEVVKLAVMYCFAPANAKPQLQVIRRVINEAALSFVQEGSGDNSDVRVVQHFSPACRVAHMGGTNQLAAAAILRTLTDADLERCKTLRNFSISQILVMILLLAATLALSGELLFDNLMDVINTTWWNGFVLANSKVYEASPAALVIIYAVGGTLVLYYFGVFTPSVERVREVRVHS
jgi:hypothetical protein